MGGGRKSGKKYRMPSRKRLDMADAGSSKRLASKFYQLKAGHCLTGQYLHWTKNRPTAQCWWCRCRAQTQDYPFKVCPAWKAQRGSCGRGAGGKREGEEPVGDPGPPCRREVQPGGIGLPFKFPPRMWEGCSRPKKTRGARCPSGSAGSAGSGKRRGGWRRRNWGPGPLPLFLPTPSFMAFADEE